jgi:signal transduction histidine kinase/CheY-like chemotaxis protein
MVTTRWPVAWWPVAAALVGLYFIAGKLGLSLAFVNASASAVWPPTGLAIAALLIFGTDLWPAIAVGAFAVNITTSGDLPSSIGIGLGNALEAVIATRLAMRFSSGRHSFERPHDVLRFTLIATIATAVAATIGVASLGVAGLAPPADFGQIWLTWWLGDTGGALLLTPLLVLWAMDQRAVTRERLGEATLLIAAAVATALIVFGGLQSLSAERYPIAFLSFPVLVWAGARFGPRAAATVAIIIAAIAVWGTLGGHGSFARPSANESLLLLQSFMAVATVTTLTLAAAVFDRRVTAARLLAAEQHARLVAEDAARAREEFLSTATHELRTPLTSLAGYAQVAQRALRMDQRDRLATSLESVSRQASRLAALITNLLDASQVASGGLDIDPRPIELSTVTAKAIEATRLIDAERHRWEVRIEAGIGANVDPLRWEQVVVNLLDNAMKYSPDGRTVAVVLRRAPTAGVVMTVHDEGIGIPADQREHVFDRFYRAHQSEGRGGLGLGLYIAREIVRRHGGDIGISSAAGEGTSVAVTLPASRIRDATPKSIAEERHDGTIAAPARRRVLVVEDDPDVRLLVTDALRDAGLDVRAAVNGREALELAAADPPDLILLDKLMPVMDGSAFSRAYRAATAVPAPIIAFCAARDTDEWARSIGAVDHVAKPFDLDELTRAVRKQLQP